MFVVYGMPRSGTTLVAQVLNAHSGLLVPDETDFMVPAAHAFRLVESPDLGRRLDEATRDACLAQRSAWDLVLILADGISAPAAQRHGA